MPCICADHKQGSSRIQTLAGSHCPIKQQGTWDTSIYKSVGVGPTGLSLARLRKEGALSLPVLVTSALGKKGNEQIMPDVYVGFLSFVFNRSIIDLSLFVNSACFLFCFVVLHVTPWCYQQKR